MAIGPRRKVVQQGPKRSGFVEPSDSPDTMFYLARWSRAWEYEVVNLFAYRTPYPSELHLVADPVGVGNDDAIAVAVRHAEKLLAAWGNHGMRVNPLNSELRARLTA